MIPRLRSWGQRSKCSCFSKFCWICRICSVRY